MAPGEGRAGVERAFLRTRDRFRMVSRAMRARASFRVPLSLQRTEDAVNSAKHCTQHLKSAPYRRIRGGSRSAGRDSGFRWLLGLLCVLELIGVILRSDSEYLRTCLRAASRVPRNRPRTRRLTSVPQLACMLSARTLRPGLVTLRGAQRLIHATSTVLFPHSREPVPTHMQHVLQGGLSGAQADEHEHSHEHSDETGPEEESEEYVDMWNEERGEWNGPRGLEPTRYGDWEKNGRCTDFR